MIEFEKVSKQFGDRFALRNVSLKIGDGELVFLAGPSGAGKTTLLRLLAGIDRPSQGRILVNQEDLTRLPSSALPFLRRKMGLIFQDHGLLPDRTVLDNVCFPLLICGAQSDDARSRAELALEKVGMAAQAQQFPPSLSGGEQQRVAIARAIVNRPKIILADEPTAHLDRDNANQVLKILKLFQSAGVTCLISSHDEQFIDQASRVVFLHQGEVVETWKSTAA